MKSQISIALIIMALTLLMASGCKSPYYSDRLAGVGAVTGALAGAAIGDAHDKTAAGAVIGTAVGALTGAAVGDAVDSDIAHAQAVMEQQMGRRLEGAVTMGDAIAMTRAGLSDDLIITHIRANGVAQRLQTHDLIELRNQGVSDAVIQAMHQTPLPQPAPVTPRRRAPVVVEEHYYVAPPVWGYYRPHRHRHYCPPPGVSWHFSIP